MAKVVQFVGIENVVEAFVNRDCKIWSLWVDRQFLFSYIGESNEDAAGNLQQVLEKLEKNRGIYTLKVYVRVKDADCVCEKDPCHGSFNFRMMAYDGDTDGTPYYRTMRDEIAALKAERDTLLQEVEDGGSDNDGLLGKLGEIFLNDPTKLPLMIQSVQGLINTMFTTQTKATGQPVAISGVNPPATQVSDQQLWNTVKTLEKKDPDLLKHLQKLLALPDPVLKQLLTALDTM